MWLDSKAVNCPQKWGNFTHAILLSVGPGGKLEGVKQLK